MILEIIVVSLLTSFLVKIVEVSLMIPEKKQNSAKKLDVRYIHE